MCECECECVCTTAPLHACTQCTRTQHVSHSSAMAAQHNYGRCYCVVHVTLRSAKVPTHTHTHESHTYIHCRGLVGVCVCGHDHRCAVHRRGSSQPWPIGATVRPRAQRRLPTGFDGGLKRDTTHPCGPEHVRCVGVSDGVGVSVGWALVPVRSGVKCACLRRVHCAPHHTTPHHIAQRSPMLCTGTYAIPVVVQHPNAVRAFVPIAPPAASRIFPDVYESVTVRTLIVWGQVPITTSHQDEPIRTHPSARPLGHPRVCRSRAL